MLTLPPLPDAIKHIAHFLKVADEHDERNIVVSYWSRMWACQVALKSISGPKPPEVSAIVINIMDWLEKTKKEHGDNDGLTNDTVAQSLIEEYALQLFNYADAQDKAQSYGKNVVKAFYTCGILMDILCQFGDLNEDLFAKRRYAKWKAAYIHNCLKRGEKPTPGPPKDHIEDSDDEDDEANNDFRIVREGRQHPKPYQPTGDGGAPTGLSDNEEDESTSSLQSPIEPNRIEPVQPMPYQPPPVQPPPFQPAPIIQPVTPQPSNSSYVAASVSAEQVKQAQKCCKYASSAMDYDDIPTAIENLQKALSLLQGRSSNAP